MKLGDVGRSGNVEDRRSGGGKMAAGGGLLGVILMIAFVLMRGGGVKEVVQVVAQNAGNLKAPQANLSPEEQVRQDEQLVFLEKILKLTEDVWTEQFAEEGERYQPPRLVVFRGSTQTACGVGQDAMGPFYCPADSQAYIDLSFYDQLDRDLKAPGDFAQAYVVAHEIGHHVQNLLGYSDIAHQARQTQPEEIANEYSVRLELQADYLSGVWAHHAHQQSNILEPGDVEEGLRAANQIGDDLLQKRASGRIVPENFTHGTSEQRVRWLRQGLKTGDFSRKTLDAFEMPYDRL
ncbi:MAG: neutral zinc metallopeptidase [Planctomycetaceae bacterium]